MVVILLDYMQEAACFATSVARVCTTTSASSRETPLKWRHAKATSHGLKRNSAVVVALAGVVALAVVVALVGVLDTAAEEVVTRGEVIPPSHSEVAERGEQRSLDEETGKSYH